MNADNDEAGGLVLSLLDHFAIIVDPLDPRQLRADELRAIIWHVLRANDLAAWIEPAALFSEVKGRITKQAVTFALHHGRATAAFWLLHENYQGLIRKSLVQEKFYRHLTPQDRDDIVFATIARIVKLGAKFDPQRAQLATYIRNQAHFAALDHLREERALPEETVGKIIVDLANYRTAQADDPDRPRDAIAQLLALLSPKHAMAVRKGYYEGQTDEDIAHELNTTPSTVRTWRRRGLQRLRELLRDPELIKSTFPHLQNLLASLLVIGLFLLAAQQPNTPISAQRVHTTPTARVAIALPTPRSASSPTPTVAAAAPARGAAPAAVQDDEVALLTVLGLAADTPVPLPATPSAAAAAASLIAQSTSSVAVLPVVPTSAAATAELWQPTATLARVVAQPSAPAQATATLLPEERVPVAAPTQLRATPTPSTLRATPVPEERVPVAAPTQPRATPTPSTPGPMLPSATPTPSALPSSTVVATPAQPPTPSSAATPLPTATASLSEPPATPTAAPTTTTPTAFVAPTASPAPVTSLPPTPVPPSPTVVPAACNTLKTTTDALATEQGVQLRLIIDPAERHVVATIELFLSRGTSTPTIEVRRADATLLPGAAVYAHDAYWYIALKQVAVPLDQGITVVVGVPGATNVGATARVQYTANNINCTRANPFPSATSAPASSTPLQGAFVLPATDDTVIVDRQATAFELRVAPHTAVDYVDFNIIDAQGHIVLSWHEYTAAFCVFGGDGQCKAAPESFWSTLPDGVYSVQVTAHARNGDPLVLTRSFTKRTPSAPTSAATQAGATGTPLPASTNISSTPSATGTPADATPDVGVIATPTPTFIATKTATLPPEAPSASVP